MHSMVFHVPEAMKRLGNVKQFTGQGTVHVCQNSHTLCRAFLLQGTILSNKNIKCNVKCKLLAEYQVNKLFTPGLSFK